MDGPRTNTKQEYTPPTKTCGRYKFIKHFGKDIADYKSIQTSLENISESTQTSYLRVLPHYFLYLNMNPDEVIAERKKHLLSTDLSDADIFERKTNAYIRTLLDKKKNGLAKTHRMRIQGFFKNNGKRLSLDLSDGVTIPKGRKRKKFSPENSEVRRLLQFADNARDKLIVTLMYQSGAAPIDVANLCCGDLPLTAWEYVERSRSKTGETWRIVTTPDIVEALKLYMALRGESKIGEPLFVGREGVLDNRGISQIVADIIQKAGFSNTAGFVPKCLRDAFEDALADAEIYSKTKKSLMGHVTDIEMQYGSYKKMQQHLIEASQKVYPLLCLNENNLKKRSPEKQLTPEMYDFIFRLMDDLASGKKKLIDG